jgi:CHAT domain/Tetratricopeptide repeat-like domain
VRVERATTPCLDAETIAAFAEGRINRSGMREVVRHLDQCQPCRDAVEAASEAILEEGISVNVPPALRRTSWLAVAAAIVVAILAVPATRTILSLRSPMARLASLSPRDERTIEPRLAGGFPWAPYRGPLRSNGAAATSARMKLTGAAGELVDRADHDKTAAAQHAAGVALALSGENPDDAIARLRLAANSLPEDAKSWSDLAAAEYAAALARGAASQIPVALADTDHALRVDPRLPEALFNRALILERIGLITQTRAAWEHYLAVDATSEWAAEARERLAKLPAVTGDAQFKRDLPRLAAAALAGDGHTVAAIVSSYPQQARIEGEQQRLADWGDAISKNDIPAADRALTVARAIGDALAQLTGETMLRDSVKAIDGATAAQRPDMAAGHVLIAKGRAASKQQRAGEAETLMREAALKLTAAGDPMALTARFYAAGARLAQNDAAHARPELEALLNTVPTPELGAEVRWELARCHTFDDDWAAALPLLDEAHARFERLGERANAGFIDTIRSSVLVTLGRSDEAWEARSRAFAALSREGREDRLIVSIDGAAQFELRAGRRDTALALLGVEEAAETNAAAPASRAATFVQKTLLNVILGNHDAALQSARDAESAAQRVPDHALRMRALADAQFAFAAVVLDRDPRHARDLLTLAIAGYRSQDLAAMIAEPYLLRARAGVKLGDATAAARDLDEGIAAVERRRIRFGGSAAGTGVLNAGVALFEDAIRLSLDRGDVAGAFAYAERAHAADVAPAPGEASGTSNAMAGLEQRLAGSGVAVLELVALPDEVVAFTVTERGASVARTRVARPTLTAERDEAKLYDLLIRPAETALASARGVIVVPDSSLENIAFAALQDGKGYFVERMPVAIAVSGASLHPGKETRPQSITAVALPSGDASHSASLPETVAELRDVAQPYRQSSVVGEQVSTLRSLTAATDVLHVAGHTERQVGLGDAALVFAGNERASWKTIATTLQPHARIIVLAACETLRRPNSPQARALSLGSAFLAAGTTDVIGTLTPIADTDAHAIFRTLHRELAAGVTPAEALRRAQREAIAAQPAHPEAWRAVALLTSRVPQL